jgi:hypothetical protein
MTIAIARIATLDSSECLSAMQSQRFGEAAVPRGKGGSEPANHTASLAAVAGWGTIF